MEFGYACRTEVAEAIRSDGELGLVLCRLDG